ncbi:hypothetical protein VMT65_12335 [Nocardia sp. CDC153]|uniref:hypothetical protein n=1 Tax=Nocardia sp. CDC153 TaxID=3112167 RepID=UPI002DBA8CA8|nr:hypothetical protein [Nocardia sp. CDC153]MEC3953819.1 hypothetical protein [Nocardia sp. CDC153]
MSWLNLPKEIRAALSKPLGAPADPPDLGDLSDPDDPPFTPVPGYTNAISFEDWKREREWTILAPPW